MKYYCVCNNSDTDGIREFSTEEELKLFIIRFLNKEYPYCHFISGIFYGDKLNFKDIELIHYKDDDK
jgi:hypothetical protein